MEQVKTDRRSARTRDTIVRAAEKLFSEHGIEAVSLNTITSAANQSNRNAVQYHFGNKDGLIKAILDKHNPGISQHSLTLLDKLLAAGTPFPRLMARIVVEPLAAKLQDTDGGAAYLHVSSELIARNALDYFAPKNDAPSVRVEERISRILRENFQHLPAEALTQRVFLMTGGAFRALSDHARYMNQSQTLSNTAFLVSNLIDCFEAILAAPPSENTMDVLTQIKSE